MLKLNCAICVELFTTADAVQVTKCGHLFHIACLEQWLERSKTCPQCRSKCTNEDVSRVYFNTANFDESCADVGALQAELGNLTLQLKVEEHTCKEFEEEIKKLNEENRKYTRTMLGMANEKSVFEEFVMRLQELNKIYAEIVSSNLDAEIRSLQLQNKSTKDQSLRNKVKKRFNFLREVDHLIEESTAIITSYNNELREIDAANDENIPENLMNILYPDGKKLF